MPEPLFWILRLPSDPELIWSEYTPYLQETRGYEWAEKGIEEILEEERGRLAAAQAEKEQELARLAEEIDNLVQEDVLLLPNIDLLDECIKAIPGQLASLSTLRYCNPSASARRPINFRRLDFLEIGFFRGATRVAETAPGCQRQTLWKIPERVPRSHCPPGQTGSSPPMDQEGRGASSF